MRLHEKGGKEHTTPCHHALAEALRGYRYGANNQLRGKDCYELLWKLEFNRTILRPDSRTVQRRHIALRLRRRRPNSGHDTVAPLMFGRVKGFVGDC